MIVKLVIIIRQNYLAHLYIFILKFYNYVIQKFEIVQFKNKTNKVKLDKYLFQISHCHTYLFQIFKKFRNLLLLMFLYIIYNLPFRGPFIKYATQ